MRLQVCSIMALLFGSGITLAGDVLYSVTDLGVLPGHFSTEGYSVNNAAQVTGAAGVDSHVVHAFLYRDASIINLGTLGGDRSIGYGINNIGQVTGYSDTSDGGGAEHAFLYSDGQMMDLGTLGGGSSLGFGINKAGRVTGNSTTAAGHTHAFLYSSGRMMDLGTLPGYLDSGGTALNDAGQVTGWSTATLGGPPFAPFHAFLYSNGQMMDLGTLGGGSSFGFGINDAGQVVGESDGHAFLYRNGEMVDVNELIDTALGIELSGASGINDRGQILAYDHTGRGRSYLLTPVPEPSALGLLGLPGLWLLTKLGLPRNAPTISKVERQVPESDKTTG